MSKKKDEDGVTCEVCGETVPRPQSRDVQHRSEQPSVTICQSQRCLDRSYEVSWPKAQRMHGHWAFSNRQFTDERNRSR